MKTELTKEDIFESQPITIEELKSLYLSTLADHKLCLYIDVPFCLKKCNFCIYNPTISKLCSNEYKDYISYLLKLLHEFRDVIALEKDEIYFGGGSADFLTVEDMYQIADSIPGFKNTQYKSFECHPALLTDEKLQFLLDNNFTFVTFGIQSLNTELMQSQGRIPLNIEKLKKQITILKSHGVSVNCDLLTFVDTGTIDDLKQFDYDLEHIWDLGCQMISCYPMYQRFNYTYTKDCECVLYNEEEDIRKIQYFRASIYKLLQHHPELCISNPDNFFTKESIKESLNIDVLVKYKNTKLNHIYNCSGYGNRLPNQISLGLGGLGKREVYGHIGRDFSYQLLNINGIPTFNRVR